jgi:hypothetical protein
MTSLQDLIGKTIVKIEHVIGYVYTIHTKTGECFVLTASHDYQREEIEIDNIDEWNLSSSDIYKTYQ